MSEQIARSDGRTYAWVMWDRATASVAFVPESIRAFPRRRPQKQRFEVKS